jgi:hypothetical protein
MSAARISAIVMLISGGLWAGIIVAYAVERVNLWRRMPLEQFAVDFRRSLYRVDPLLPILLVICGIGAAAYAFQTSGQVRAITAIGVGLLGVVLVSSIVIAEPMNSKFRQLTEGSVPVGAAGMRVAWRRFHLARTAVAFAAYASLVVAATRA